MLQVLVTWIGLISVTSMTAWALPAPTTPASIKKSHVEVPELIETNGTEYTISAFSPKMFVRTSEFTLNSTNCIQFTYKLMDKRVRLHAYTCQLSEGGFCTLDKFYYPRDKEGCTYLRPWSHKVDSFSFYFVLEKRVRKYGRGYELRNKTRRSPAKRHTKFSRDTIGLLQLSGIMECDDACNINNGGQGSHSDGTFYRKKTNRLDY